MLIASKLGAQRSQEPRITLEQDTGHVKKLIDYMYIKGIIIILWNLNLIRGRV